MRNRPRRAMVRGMDGVYHLLSRTSCRQYLFGDEEKEMFVRLMRRQADFCGVDVLSYCVMSNHFHILARVRYEPEVSDAELMRRHRILYGGSQCLSSRLIDEKRVEREKEGSKGGDYGEDKDEE